jgi:hypothetical protein
MISPLPAASSTSPSRAKGSRDTVLVALAVAPEDERVELPHGHRHVEAHLRPRPVSTISRGPRQARMPCVSSRGVRAPGGRAPCCPGGRSCRTCS